MFREGRPSQVRPSGGLHHPSRPRVPSHDPAGLDLLGEVAGDEVPVERAQLGLLVAAARRLHERAARVEAARGRRVAGLGRSPVTRIALRARSTTGSGIGTAETA